MGAYTNFLEEKSYDILNEEDYIEELKKVVELFRTFDKALDAFLVEHEFAGAIEDADEKVRFITERMKAAGVPIPRNIKKWYSEHKMIKRKTAFQICFAFHLKEEEVDDFLRRICLTRGFDCHSVEEVVYFFAFKNGLSYQEAANIMEQVRIVKPENLEGEEVVYTKWIAEEIDEIKSVEELVLYLNENAYKFKYNNVAAYNSIQNLWEKIAKKNGLADREKELLYISFDKDEEEKLEPREEGKKKKEDVEEKKEDSIWEVYLQILGLSGNYTANAFKDRSIKSLLKDNELLHPLAEASFPDRFGLNEILIGRHVSYERVRKLLILLLFYDFWADKALRQRDYRAADEDIIRCACFIDDNLLEVGYPILYTGNPYDFIILVAMHSECPLVTFRDYMREMFFEKVDIDSLNLRNGIL